LVVDWTGSGVDSGDLEDPTDLGGSVVDLGGSVSDSVFVSRTSAESQGTVTVTILLEMVVTMVVE
jgi:hypothetical protein